MSEWRPIAEFIKSENPRDFVIFANSGGNMKVCRSCKGYKYHIVNPTHFMELPWVPEVPSLMMIREEKKQKSTTKGEKRSQYSQDQTDTLSNK
jgi:hypothetical protein